MSTPNWNKLPDLDALAVEVQRALRLGNKVGIITHGKHNAKKIGSQAYMGNPDPRLLFVSLMFTSVTVKDETFYTHGHYRRKQRSQGLPPRLPKVTGKDETLSTSGKNAVDVELAVNILSENHDCLRYRATRENGDGIIFTMKDLEEIEGKVKAFKKKIVKKYLPQIDKALRANDWRFNYVDFVYDNRFHEYDEIKISYTLL